ncbi:MAG: hypothetical protein AAF899_17445 [Pseudomonadota bacterium]
MPDPLALMAPAASLIEPALLLDVLRLGHLAAIAAGIGAVIATDLTMLRWIGLPIGTRQGDALEAAHALIAPALALAWITGLALLVWRTGLQADALSPKLMVKLAVVTMLTANAVLITRGVRPTLQEWRGGRLIMLPLGRKLLLASAGAFSVAGWAAALILGGSAMVRTAGWDVLLPLIGGLYMAVLAATLTFALVAHIRWWRRRDTAVWMAAE